MANDELRILATPRQARRIAQRLTRRNFLAVTGLGAAGAALLAACGGSSKSEAGATSTTSGASSSTAGSTAASSSPSTSAAATTAGSTAASSGPTSIDPKAHKYNLYTWAEYDDPDLMKKFGTITIDVYNSNEDAIAKLEASGGTSGYDMVVPTGAYIPQMAEKGLLMPLNLDLITNFKNLDPIYTQQPWDPDNKFSVCKDWGTTGWIYDKTQVKTEIKTWTDFNNAVMGEAKGNASVLDSAPDLCGLYFWANGVSWTTTDPVELAKCQDFIVNKLAPNVKAFNSYPAVDLTSGNYVLSQVFNGDARAALTSVKNPDKYVWGLGSPTSELWMDNWCIVAGAKNVDAAYNFINFILVPENSAIDLEYHGYNTGIKGIEALVPADLPYRNMIFFSPDEVKTMQPYVVNEAQQKQVDIYNQAKAKAGS